MPVDQVQQWEQVDPDDVDEVPVQAADFERRVIFGREPAFPCHPEEPGENAESDDHVQRVQAGHHEVQSEENLRRGADWRTGRDGPECPRARS